MISGVLVTLRGVEDLAVKELKRLVKVSSVSTTPGVVVFKVASFDDLCKVAYKSQFASRVLLLASAFQLPPSILFDEFPKAELQKIVAGLPTDEKYSVLTLRSGDHEFSSQDVTSALAKGAQSLGVKISFKESTALLLCVIVDDTCYVGLDVAGVDLSKREHRMFTSSFTSKASLAFAMLELAAVKDGMIVLDPLCRDGTLMIEAALAATGRSPRFFEKKKLWCEKKCSLESFDSEHEQRVTLIASDPEFRNLSYTKKNAKIVQVDGVLEFRKSALDDLDIKYEPESVDRVLAILHPSQIKNVKFFDRFFVIMREILAKKGVLVLAAPCEIPVPIGFSSREDRRVWMGKDQWHLLCLVKK